MMSYNFRQAKKEYMKRQGESPMDSVLRVVKKTPGAWKRIFELQKKNMFSGKEGSNATRQ